MTSILMMKCWDILLMSWHAGKCRDTKGLRGKMQAHLQHTMNIFCITKSTCIFLPLVWIPFVFMLLGDEFLDYNNDLWLTSRFRLPEANTQGLIWNFSKRGRQRTSMSLSDNFPCQQQFVSVSIRTSHSYPAKPYMKHLLILWNYVIGWNCWICGLLLVWLFLLWSVGELHDSYCSISYHHHNTTANWVSLFVVFATAAATLSIFFVCF